MDRFNEDIALQEVNQVQNCNLGKYLEANALNILVFSDLS
jgi:hypothetical protein